MIPKHAKIAAQTVVFLINLIIATPLLIWGSLGIYNSHDGKTLVTDSIFWMAVGMVFIGVVALWFASRALWRLSAGARRRYLVRTGQLVSNAYID